MKIHNLVTKPLFGNCVLCETGFRFIFFIPKEGFGNKNTQKDGVVVSLSPESFRDHREILMKSLEDCRFFVRKAGRISQKD